MKGRYAPLGVVVAVAVAGISAVTPLHAHAADLPATCLTLQTELNAANAGDTITLATPDVSNPGHDRPCKQSTDGITYPITLPNKSITLTGAQSSDGFDGEGAHQLVTGSNVGSTTISNLTFQNGSSSSSGGAALNVDAGANSLDLTISNDRFFGNTSTTGAGAVALSSGGSVSGVHTVTVTGSTFGGSAAGEGNSSSTDSAGALFINVDSEVSITHNSFIDNSSAGGDTGVAVAGGVFAMSDTSDARIVFSSNVVRGNTEVAGGMGGGASLQGRQLSVTGNTFDHNSIGDATANFPESLGGGLYVFFTGSGANSQIDLDQSQNVFTGNSVGSFGYTGGASSTVYFGGGGEYVQAPSTLSAFDTFIGNTVGDSTRAGTAGAGGGIAVQGSAAWGPSTLVATGLVATNNVASVDGGGYGGGIYAGFSNGCASSCPATVSLYDSTVDHNTASEGPGASGGELTADVGNFYNDIVYGNIANSETSRATSRSVATGGAAQLNFSASTLTVAYTDSCDGSGNAYAGSGNICADPLLADPANNNVEETSSSPTINAGNNADILEEVNPVDYEGDPRVQQGVVDMGADEFAPPSATPGPPVPNTGADVAPQAAVAIPMIVTGVLLLGLAGAARRRRRR